jgi:ribulose-phosphate 3-epimerase
MSEIIPTIVPKRFDEIEAFAARFADIAPVLHLDMTDGEFAFPTTWMPGADDALPESAMWEVHLMAHDPRAVGERFIRAGAWRIIGHAEVLAGDEGVATLQGWRAMGAHEVGVALKFDTPLSAVEHLAPHADVLHLMSIRKIGAQGQMFDDEALSRIADAKSRFPHLVISVDGGINEKNVADVVRAGASRVCVGAALAAAPDPVAAYSHLRILINDTVQ